MSSGLSKGEIMSNKDRIKAPDSTTVRVALWRALHVEVDPLPQVFEDEVGLKLAGPDDGWRNRPDMSPFTKSFRDNNGDVALLSLCAEVRLTEASSARFI
jgi:hypothetical protein